MSYVTGWQSRKIQIFAKFYVKIERWWKELHERMEKFFKDQLNWLKDRAYYDPDDDIDRYM